jgi:hypothetical protein
LRNGGAAGQRFEVWQGFRLRRGFRRRQKHYGGQDGAIVSGRAIREIRESATKSHQFFFAPRVQFLFFSPRVWETGIGAIVHNLGINLRVSGE